MKTYRIFTGAPKLTSQDVSLLNPRDYVDEITNANSIYPNDQSQSYFQQSGTLQDESEESKSLEIKSNDYRSCKIFRVWCFVG